MLAQDTAGTFYKTELIFENHIVAVFPKIAVPIINGAAVFIQHHDGETFECVAERHEFYVEEELDGVTYSQFNIKQFRTNVTVKVFLVKLVSPDVAEARRLSKDLGKMTAEMRQRLMQGTWASDPHIIHYGRDSVLLTAEELEEYRQEVLSRMRRGENSDVVAAEVRLKILTKHGLVRPEDDMTEHQIDNILSSKVSTAGEPPSLAKAEFRESQKVLRLGGTDIEIKLDGALKDDWKLEE